MPSSPSLASDMGVVTATILSEGTALDHTCAVVAIDIRREANRIPRATLVLMDGDATTGDFAVSSSTRFEPGRLIEIKLRYEGGSGGDNTVFKGPVVRHAIEAHGGGSALRVEMRDAAIRLAQGRKSAVYRDKTDADVAGAIISAAGLRKGEITATKTTHPELVQHACSDWDFIAARADANGLLVVAEDGKLSLAKPELSGSAVLTVEYGMDIHDLEFELDAASQFDDVQGQAWDLKEQKPTAAVKAKSLDLAQGNLKGDKMAQALSNPPLLLSHPVPVMPDELQAWADARLQRSRMAMIRGRVTVQGTALPQLLDLIEIKGVGDRFNGKALVTGLSHRVDQGNWRTDIQIGLSPRRFCEEDGLLDAPAAGLLPAVGGLQIGVVAAFKEDPDKQLRVQVELVGLGSEAGPVWARLAVPDGGKARGFFFRPEPGDEVVVGFFNQDPRQPVILGSLYGSKNTAPKDLVATEDNLAKGIVSRAGTKILFTDADKPKLTLETPAKNTIVLDDDQEAIVITDKHGNKITLDKDGITIDSAKDLKFSAKGNVEIKGQKVDVK
ncbi:Type VI secretion system tip protein VgrG [Rubrivivax sp. A210]|uniref:type VI secretion system tip protein VgrG n=1 Tax=Rubrivivax sp. A210 TaxID=2772301 RepID=UPI00191A9AFF|nr:type VI secretion system tip protein VgrG [Rubrivivax sp. A210]CAD5372267.1 Type VI secretion system tip protein VgrG [Rubrivivax sp. A210]